MDREEFGNILHLTGELLVEEDIDEMFGEADNNKDGKLDFDGKVIRSVSSPMCVSSRLKNMPRLDFQSHMPHF